MKENVQRKGQPPGRKIAGTSKVKRVTNKQRVVLSVVNGNFSVSEGTKKEVDPSTKIKLQLFPVDEATRSRIEKDGLNPFLELTLKARKKISSVIKHIHTKWSGSCIGKPMLLPYDAQLRHNIRWTLKDSDISAGDVYTTLQTPPIFRLCYGWYCDEAPERGSEGNDMRKPIDTSTPVVDATTRVAVTPPPPPPPLADENKNNGFQATDISMGGLFSEASLQGKPNNTVATWDDDNLTVLSIGGLLSEASLQAKINNNNNEGDSAVVQRSNCCSSSILDAEETCHAFALRNSSSFSFATKNLPQPSTSNPFRFPEVVENSCGPELKLQVFPPLNQQFIGEDSRSLGLRGLSWNESSGPFDLANSMPWKVSGA